MNHPSLHSSCFLFICFELSLYVKKKNLSEAELQGVGAGCKDGTHFALCAGVAL